jgi:hypothetical protein
MAKKPEPEISKVQRICIDALNGAIDNGDITQGQAEPLLTRCREPLPLAPEQ